MFKNEIFAEGNYKYIRNVFWKLIEIVQGDDVMTKLFFIHGVVAFAPYGAAVLYMFFSNIDFQLRVGGKVTGIKQTLISYDNKRIAQFIVTSYWIYVTGGNVNTL